MCRFTDIFVRFKSTELFKDTKHVFTKFSTVKKKKKKKSRFKTLPNVFIKDLNLKKTLQNVFIKDSELYKTFYQLRSICL